jgi:hypothetical protein
MGTKLETLQEKLAKLQAEIQAEQERERQEKAIAEVRDTFRSAIVQAVQEAEKATGKSLRQIGLGIWVAYPAGSDNGHLAVSALAVAEDGLPKAFKRTPSKNGNGQHNGNGNGHSWDYFLKDGRGPYASTLEALDAMGFPKDKRGQYYHRWDRLPKELQEQNHPQAEGRGKARGRGQREGQRGQGREGQEVKAHGLAA